MIAFTDTFKTKDGADLKLVLSKQAVGKLEKTPSFTDAMIITSIKAPKGRQHYVLPESVKLEKFARVLIYSAGSNTLWGGFNIPAAGETDDTQRIGDFFHDTTEDASSYGS